jgi:hypothetical protein
LHSTTINKSLSSSIEIKNSGLPMPLELLNYSQILNNDLHKLKIKEDKRSLLVSGTLIALKNKDFYRGYIELPSNKMLASALVDTIKEQLVDEDLQGDKIDRLMENYSFIKSHPSLIHKNKKKELKDLRDLICFYIYNISKKFSDMGWR